MAPWVRRRPPGQARRAQKAQPMPAKMAHLCTSFDISVVLPEPGWPVIMKFLQEAISKAWLHLHPSTARRRKQRSATLLSPADMTAKAQIRDKVARNAWAKHLLVGPAMRGCLGTSFV